MHEHDAESQRAADPCRNALGGIVVDEDITAGSI